jgi:MFS family permease
MGWREDLAVLRHRDVRTFLAARFTSLLGASIAPIALAFAVLDVSDSAAALGVVLAARSIPNVIFLLIGGVIADRLPRHRVLVVANSVCALTQAAAATLLVTGQAQIWQLAAIEAVNGTAAAFALPASMGVLPALVDRAELPQANAVAGFARSVAVIGGGAAAGVIVGFAGPATGLYIDALSFLIAALLIARLSMPRIERAASSILHDLREGWSEFVSRQWVWTVVAAFGLINMVWAACWYTLGPVIADDTFGRAGWGVTSACFGVGLVVGGLTMIRLKPRHPLRLGVAAMLVQAPALVLLVLAPYTAVMAVVGFAVGVGWEWFGIGWETALGQHIPLDKLSRVSSYDALGSFVAIPVGQLSVGYVAAAAGVRTVELVGAALLGVLVLAMLAVPSVWRLDRT